MGPMGDGALTEREESAMLSFEQIKELIELVSRHGLERLELERSGFRLAVAGRRDETAAQVAPEPAGASASTAAPPRTEPGATGASPTARAAPPVAAPTGAEEAELPSDLHVLESPIVGTFYGAPAPDAEPFVRVGDRVRKGQVLCIVEAMKLMNEIESDVDGEIVQVMPKNAQPV
jgi:acetyl-CoA carboxylase biotin carboxyl carrier protein